MATKKNKPVYKKTSRSTQIIIGILVIAFAGYMIYSNFIVNKVNTTSGNNKIGHSVYDFRKQGDLTFKDSENNFISRVDIEIAEDDEARTTGLMYRAKMEEEQGMLFIFPVQRYQSFWMRNTVIPLDIIFVDNQMKIVTIRDNAKPFDESSYASTAPAQYVVEVNAGYASRHGISEGDKIIWRRN